MHLYTFVVKCTFHAKSSTELVGLVVSVLQRNGASGVSVCLSVYLSIVFVEIIKIGLDLYYKIQSKTKSLRTREIISKGRRRMS
jgi:hypothetical protein